jgi:hypothetical protein
MSTGVRLYSQNPILQKNKTPSLSVVGIIIYICLTPPVKVHVRPWFALSFPHQPGWPVCDPRMITANFFSDGTAPYRLKLTPYRSKLQGSTRVTRDRRKNWALVLSFSEKLMDKKIGSDNMRWRGAIKTDRQ